MAYSAATAVPYLVTQPIAGFRLWVYSSVDANTLVRVSGYFTDGYNRGMRQGDLILVTDNDASPVITTSHVVNVTGTTVDLSDGITLGSTNTD